MSKEYDEFAAGLVIVRANDANWNADFSGWPRKLPGGGFYATDKALKFAIRRYLAEMHDKEGNKVLFKRVYNEKGEVGSLKAILKQAGIKSTDKQMAEEILKQCIDVRLFGGTFTIEDSNFSITGPVQITYGRDIYNKGKTYVNQIGSPKLEEEKKEYGKQTTLGKEIRLTEAHYAYDFTINPNNLKKDSFLCEVAKGNNYLRTEDIDLLLEALKFGPTYQTSTTKVGAFTELVIFAEYEMDDDKVPLVPILKNEVEIKDVDKIKRKIDITRLIETMSSYDPSSIRIYYDKNTVELGNNSKFSKMKIETIF